MARTQKNKATNYHLGTLKAKLAKLRNELLIEQGGGGGGGGCKLDMTCFFFRCDDSSSYLPLMCVPNPPLIHISSSFYYRDLQPVKVSRLLDLEMQEWHS